MVPLSPKHGSSDKNTTDSALGKRSVMRNPWACSWATVVTALVGFGALFLMAQSFLTRQLDVKGCEMSYMWPSLIHFEDFDTKHTRFASKYSLHLYREGGIDQDARVRARNINVWFLINNMHRLKEYPFFSSQGTPAATNRFVH